MKFYLYIFFFLGWSNFVNAQVKNFNSYNELKEWAIRGKVRGITLFIYNDDDQQTLKRTLKDTFDWSIKTTVYYNKLGNTEKIITLKRNGGSFDSLLTTYMYDGNNFLGRAEKNRQLINLYKRNWISSTSYVDSVFDQDRNFLSENITNLNSDLRITSQRNKYFISDEGKFTTESVEYFFSKDNYLNEVKSIDVDTRKITYDFKNINYNFEHLNNPVKTFKFYSKDSHLNRLIIRTFAYYK